jgi:hypothetical protein
MNNLTLDERPFSYTELAEKATDTIEATVDREELCVVSFYDTVAQLQKDIDALRVTHPRVELYNISVSLNEALIELKKLI